MLYCIAQVLRLRRVYLIAYYDCCTVCYLATFHCASVRICYSALCITFVILVCLKRFVSYQRIRPQYLHRRFFCEGIPYLSVHHMLYCIAQFLRLCVVQFVSSFKLKITVASFSNYCCKRIMAIIWICTCYQLPPRKCITIFYRIKEQNSFIR